MRMYLKRHWVGLSLILCGLSTLAAYWPVRMLLVEEDRKDYIVTSSLTVSLVLVLGLAGGALWHIIMEKRLQRWHWAFRFTMFLVSIYICFEWLALWGYDPRWR